ncbi:hypothetical protein RFZ44_26980, partial [Acinetobacter sp. 163]|nr:hypothetical protein [Acinetobacter sp. 163]
VNTLPHWLQPILLNLSPERAAAVQEIRIRSNAPIQLVTKETILTAAPEFLLTQHQLEDILFTLCGGSIYAHEAEIAQGF